ncbi:MAG TPA: hypothetical protein VF992_08380 [Thermoplasmata archaeon]
MVWTTRRLIAVLSVPFALVLATVVVATYMVPRVTLQADQPTYRVGDPVRFFVHNGLEDPAFLACAAPWHISREVDGAWRPVEAHLCLAVIVPVAPGETRNWTWVSQTTTDRPDLAPVEPGRYRIEMSVMTQCASPGQGCTTVPLTAYFRLQ